MNKVIKQEKIKNMIYEKRRKQVMLDNDLAKLYGTETKRINEAVRNNPLKFPERYRFRVSKNELENFLSRKFRPKKTYIK